MWVRLERAEPHYPTAPRASAQVEVLDVRSTSSNSPILVERSPPQQHTEPDTQPTERSLRRSWSRSRTPSTGLGETATRTRRAASEGRHLAGEVTVPSPLRQDVDGARLGPLEHPPSAHLAQQDTQACVARILTLAAEPNPRCAMRITRMPATGNPASGAAVA
jgi:hypothetical protein